MASGKLCTVLGTSLVRDRDRSKKAMFDMTEGAVNFGLIYMYQPES